MKKRSMAALALLVCLLLSLGTIPAGAVSESTALETVRALGILAGDENGNLNLTSSVTRAEFVTMMTAASAYKDTVSSGTGVSLFKDVKSSHWASQYIRLAVEQEWMVGFADGTFRPDNPISLEEGCTALLKLLGYQSSDLVGSYPSRPAPPPPPRSPWREAPMSWAPPPPSTSAPARAASPPATWSPCCWA